MLTRLLIYFFYAVDLGKHLSGALLQAFFPHPFAPWPRGKNVSSAWSGPGDIYIYIYCSIVPFSCVWCVQYAYTACAASVYTRFVSSMIYIYIYIYCILVWLRLPRAVGVVGVDGRLAFFYCGAAAARVGHGYTSRLSIL